MCVVVGRDPSSFSLLTIVFTSFRCLFSVAVVLKGKKYLSLCCCYGRISFSFLLHILMLPSQLLEPSCLVEIISTHTSECLPYKKQEGNDRLLHSSPVLCIMTSDMFKSLHCPQQLESEHNEKASEDCCGKNRIVDVHISGYFSPLLLLHFFTVCLLKML